MFENALVELEVTSPDFYEKIMAIMPWKSLEQIKSHYEKLVADTAMIEQDEIGGLGGVDNQWRTGPCAWWPTASSAVLPSSPLDFLFASSSPDCLHPATLQSPALPLLLACLMLSCSVSVVTALRNRFDAIANSLLTLPLRSSAHASSPPVLALLLALLLRLLASISVCRLARSFLEGLDMFGKGEWKNIAEIYVPTKTASQVASHGQKYYRRLKCRTPVEKRRASIHDIRIVNSSIVETYPRQPTRHSVIERIPQSDRPKNNNNRKRDDVVEQHDSSKADPATALNSINNINSQIVVEDSLDYEKLFADYDEIVSDYNDLFI
uniref:HTH myb-type domain-containing protein n=1 Tax=Chenopodium quinoa TaxID=63459 RepID=A0A803LNP5_CHEQI